MQPQDANGNAHSCVSVVFTPGAVAAGLSVVLEVEICADELGDIDAAAAVETETETFLIPISAPLTPSGRRRGGRSLATSLRSTNRRSGWCGARRPL